MVALEHLWARIRGDGSGGSGQQRVAGSGSRRRPVVRGQWKQSGARDRGSEEGDWRTGPVDQKQNQIWAQLDSLQTLSSMLWKNWKKYLVIDHEPRNTFCYSNFLKFEMEFEWKFREARAVLNFGYLIKIARDFENSWNLA
jgi:hypothetical protein